MHWGTGGCVGSSVAAVVEGSVTGGSVTGGSVVGCSVTGGSVVGCSVTGGSVVSVAGGSVVVGSVAVFCTVVDSVAVLGAAVEGSVVARGEVSADASRVGAEGAVAAWIEGISSPVSGCDVSPKKNAAAKMQTITTAAIAAYCHFFILRDNGRASQPPAHGLPCPAGQDGCRQCHG